MVDPLVHTKFQLNLTSGSEEEVENRFQDGRRGGHCGYRIRMILTTVNLLIALNVHTKYGVDLLSGLGEEVENAKSLMDRRTDGQTTDRRRTTRHDISSPGPIGPGELITF